MPCVCLIVVSTKAHFPCHHLRIMHLPLFAFVCLREAAEKSSVDLPGPELRHDLEMAYQEMEVVEDEIASGKRK